MEMKAQENTKYSRNETILKIDENGDYEKATAFEKYSVWVRKRISSENMRKTILKAHYGFSVQNMA